MILIMLQNISKMVVCMCVYVLGVLSFCFFYLRLKEFPCAFTPSLRSPKTQKLLLTMPVDFLHPIPLTSVNS